MMTAINCIFNDDDVAIDESDSPVELELEEEQLLVALEPVELSPSAREIIYVPQPEDVDVDGNHVPTEHEIIGDAARLLDDPSFDDQLVKRVALDAPLLRRTKKRQVVRDWEVSTGPIDAPAGEVVTVTIRPQMYFRGEKLIATDTASPAGTGTRVMMVMVGEQIQRPAFGAFGTLTLAYALNAFGNGNLWSTCQPGLALTIMVRFVQTVTFEASIFGTAVLVR